MVILLADANSNAALLHYLSKKAQRVTRSVLAAEVYAFVELFDFAYTLKHDLKNILRKDLNIVLFTDSRCLLDTITRLSSTSEKRLLIDISAQRESYCAGDIHNIKLVSSEYNIANSLTKKSNCALFKNFSVPHIERTPSISGSYISEIFEREFGYANFSRKRRWKVIHLILAYLSYIQVML